jgi:flagellar biosynthesis protein FlhB
MASNSYQLAFVLFGSGLLMALSGWLVPKSGVWMQHMRSEAQRQGLRDDQLNFLVAGLRTWFSSLGIIVMVVAVALFVCRLAIGEFLPSPPPSIGR